MMNDASCSGTVIQHVKTAARYFPLFVVLGLIACSTIIIHVPATPDQAFQAAARQQDRVVFTIYFYWYKSGASLDSSPHVVDKWPASRTTYINSRYFPGTWPGPRDASDMVRNVSGSLFKDSNTYHVPADQPTYNTTGDVVGELATGVMENITTWFDWMNPAWHEWELRGMVSAGIDVVMPDYWNSGLPSGSSSQDALVTLVAARHALVEKVSHEADVRDPTTYHPVATYGQALVPKIAMFFDTTCMMGLWAWNRSMDVYGDATHAGEFSTAGPGADLNDPFWQEEFWKCIDRFYSVVNGTDAFAWNGSSIVWLYGADYFEDVGTTVLQYCKARFLDTYNRSLLFAGPAGWDKAGIDAICDWGGCFYPRYPVLKGIPAGALSPGFYNIGALICQDPRYVLRDPTRYRMEWQRMMDLGAAWVFVETWNELHEGTSICWTQEHGYEWIDSTRSMADAFHSIQAYAPLRKLNTVDFYVFTAGLVGLCMIGLLSARKTRVIIPASQ